MNWIVSVIIISLLPFLYLFTQTQVVGSFAYAFGNIAGFFGAIFFFWEFILGIKDLAKKIAPNSATFVKLHIMLGVWGMFFVLIHPILEIKIYGLSSLFGYNFLYGEIAFFFALLIWITSAFIRNKLSYKKWLNIHYLSYPLMFFVFVHALTMGSFLRTFIFIKGYWFLLLGTYLILVLWRVGIALKKLVQPIK